MKQGWQAVCMKGPWDSERQVPVQSLLYLGSRHQWITVMRKTPHCSFKDVLTWISSFFWVCCCTLDPLPKGEAGRKDQWEVSDDGQEPWNRMGWIPRLRRWAGLQPLGHPATKIFLSFSTVAAFFPPKWPGAWVYLAFYVSFGWLMGLQHKQLLPAEFASLKHHYTLHRTLGYQDYAKDCFSWFFAAPNPTGLGRQGRLQCVLNVEAEQKQHHFERACIR